MADKKVTPKDPAAKAAGAAGSKAATRVTKKSVAMKKSVATKRTAAR